MARRPTVDEVSAPYANFMRTPAPAGPDVCRILHEWLRDLLALRTPGQPSRYVSGRHTRLRLADMCSPLPCRLTGQLGSTTPPEAARLSPQQTSSPLAAGRAVTMGT